MSLDGLLSCLMRRFCAEARRSGPVVDCEMGARQILKRNASQEMMFGKSFCIVRHTFGAASFPCLPRLINGGMPHEIGAGGRSG